MLVLLALVGVALCGTTPCECDDTTCAAGSCASDFLLDSSCENEALCLAGEMACQAGVCCDAGLTLSAGDQCCSYTNCESSDAADFFIGKSDSTINKCFGVDLDGFPIANTSNFGEDTFGMFSIVTSHRGEGVFPYEAAFGTDTDLVEIEARLGIVNETEGDMTVVFETDNKRKIRVTPSYTIRRALPAKFKWEMEYVASRRPSGGLYGFGTPYADNSFVKATAVFTNKGKHDVVLDRVRYEAFVDTTWTLPDPLQLDNYFTSGANGDIIIHGARCAPQTSVAEAGGSNEVDGLNTTEGTFCLPGAVSSEQALVTWDNVVVPRKSTVRMSVIYVKIDSAVTCETDSYLTWLEANLGNDDMWWKDLTPLEKKQEYNFACSIDRVETSREDVVEPCP